MVDGGGAAGVRGGTCGGGGVHRGQCGSRGTDAGGTRRRALRRIGAARAIHRRARTGGVAGWDGQWALWVPALVVSRDPLPPPERRTASAVAPRAGATGRDRL